MSTIHVAQPHSSCLMTKGFGFVSCLVLDILVCEGPPEQDWNSCQQSVNRLAMGQFSGKLSFISTHIRAVANKDKQSNERQLSVEHGVPRIRMPIQNSKQDAGFQTSCTFFLTSYHSVALLIFECKEAVILPTWLA